MPLLDSLNEPVATQRNRCNARRRRGEGRLHQLPEPYGKALHLPDLIDNHNRMPGSGKGEPIQERLKRRNVDTVLPDPVRALDRDVRKYTLPVIKAHELESLSGAGGANLCRVKTHGAQVVQITGQLPDERRLAAAGQSGEEDVFRIHVRFYGPGRNSSCIPGRL